MRTPLIGAAFLIVSLAACGGSKNSYEAAAPTPTPAPVPTATPEPARCNGNAALCERRFNEVAFATTHNAFSNAEDGFLGPNQNFAVPRQFADGVRALMLDVYVLDDVVTLCHGVCDLGSRPLADTLIEIREFLDANPREIVSIIFESYVDGEIVTAVFDEVDLTRLAHTQAAGDAWPTLTEMIDTDSRLVVFTDSGALAQPWYLGVWDHAFETHYSWSTPEDFDCDPNRGNPASPLFILNHFLTDTFGSPDFAEAVNYNPLLGDRAEECRAENTTLPNFVTVDFYDIGDVIEVVAGLNR
ncbi:MAG: hypothetical protein ABGY42_17810 [bacterium]